MLSVVHSLPPRMRPARTAKPVFDETRMSSRGRCQCAGFKTLLDTPTQEKPFDESYYGSWFAEAIEEDGLPDDCVLHGLRKCAARKLTDFGLSEETIKSITGHVTSKQNGGEVRQGRQPEEAGQASDEELGERQVNCLTTEIGKRDCQTDGKRWGQKLILAMKSWRSLGESNPSFQIENLTS